MKNSIAAVLVLTVLLAMCSKQPKPEIPQPASTPAATVSSTPAVAAVSGYETLLTIGEVEKVSGITGIKTVEKGSQPGAGGVLNFADDKGALVLLLNGESISPEMFADFKAKGTYKGVYSGQVSGIGDDAWIGPAQGTPFILSVYKGNKWITISSMLNVTSMQPILTIEQLKELGRVIAAKL